MERIGRHAHRSIRFRTSRRTASRCGRPARAIPRGCWSCSLTRVARPCRCRSSAMAGAGRPTGGERHQGDLGAAQGRRIGRDTEPKIEATLIKRLDGSRWRALVKPAKKLSSGDVVRFGNEGRVCLLGHLDAEVEHKGDDGEITLSFSFHGPTLDQAIADLGTPPLPPYIASKRAPDERDAADYQTMFAANEGAVAAPTAGLHFTPALEAALTRRGVGMHRITLHVGAGTFLPVKADDTAGHRMHSEWGIISAETAHALNAARAAGGRIIAVGTTSLRLLESAAAEDGTIEPSPAKPLSSSRRDIASRCRHPPDQFPPAAFDPFHAGLGIQRPGGHETGLCPRGRERLQVLFLWGCLPAVP